MPWEQVLGHKDNVNATEVRTQMFSNVKDVSRIQRIVVLAHKMNAMIMFTLVDKALHVNMTEHCKKFNVPSQDLLGPLVSRLSTFLCKNQTGLPRGSAGTRRKPLSEKYFKRVEAVEFTIKQDDGAACKNLQKADVILLGVSRRQTFSKKSAPL
jgi:regulator of PEP synthase PpsR (kinase-PPPase family)